MNYRTIILFLLIFFRQELQAQLPKLSGDWEQTIIAKLPKADRAELFTKDYSNIISNQVRFQGDPWSSYIGVFGQNNKRIDFHLTANKINADTYSIKGKSKLGENIRELNGEIKLRQSFLLSPTEYLMTFEYKLKEPGDKDGDGIFIGIGSFIFGMQNSQPDIYWSESGDFRQFNNMFVGVWNKYNSKTSAECIFSFDAAGTYTKLPFRDNFYKKFEDKDECKCSYKIKDEYKQYGWQNYEKTDGHKSNWWK